MIIYSISISSFPILFVSLRYKKCMNMSKLNANIGLQVVSKIGSTENGTVRDGVFLAAIKNRLYFCSVFGTQMQNIEY